MIISGLARRSGCQVETIRYYERQGLLPAPDRSSGNYRLYRQIHVERLLFIRHCRSLDMTLDEIRRLLDLRDRPQASGSEANALLEKRIGQVAQRIEELQALQRQLLDLHGQCHRAQALVDCNI
ncbi:Cd(II)/Pb(II)-responsive transcriptional regulator [Noviherbaspirillum sedimenti]|uniref:Cd(II)/Pb(II)-responsive transcriptional regulator n=2 Tax=Noviherbaspirillum sedimenti TaxID=2320865 RepID=A0A3A3G2P2_9BURK|nr:Cd(II)/Pb(II)-responsive transcriptional regulator [Noviherbaspirillum sedimenti]RJG02763.1 Cd(II)/Pb(II)-responsive transcriptional regulator [Noviherbaspirillum sedimenti]